MNLKLREQDRDFDLQEVKSHLNQLAGYFIVADAKETDWQNDSNTLVLTKDPNGQGLDFFAGVGLAELVGASHAHVFDHMVEDYITYYRLVMNKNNQHSKCPICGINYHYRAIQRHLVRMHGWRYTEESRNEPVPPSPAENKESVAQ